MSSPEHDPKRAASEVGGSPVGADTSDADLIGVRRGMFGVRGSGDTSGYGRLIRQVTIDEGSPRPYGFYFDEIVDRLAEALKADDDVEFADAIEKVVVYRNELTLHVRRELLPHVARRLRDDAQLRFELCLGVNGVHYPDETGRELHAVYPLSSITHTRPTTGTSARPTTSSASSSTATRR
jgi:NADH-quinone oxidoreductase subunit C